MQKNERGSTLKYRIGTYRSGLAIMIPDDLNTDSVSSYIQSLILDDQIDLLCVTEYLVQKNEHSNISTQEAQNTALVNESLRKLLDDPVFSVGLERLGLRTSAAFVRFGSQLSWPTASISML